jgi:phosphonoacetaldehyde hydrolase
LFEVLTAHTDPLPGVIESVEKVRAMGVAIGSTTGYSRSMMDLVIPASREKGYYPDCVVCPEDAGGKGRPFPYMLWHNLERLGVESIGSVLKVGDTAADMQEGNNAGCLCVGILRGSSMLGLTQAELEAKSAVEINALLEAAKERYINAGANFIIEEISALPGLIESLNSGAEASAMKEFISADAIRLQSTGNEAPYA